MLQRLCDEAGEALEHENAAPFQAFLRRCRTGGRKTAGRPLQPPRPCAADPQQDAVCWQAHWAGIEAARPVSLADSFRTC
eukprot:2130580-Lingulodinium_polyedra.AAC.1